MDNKEQVTEFYKSLTEKEFSIIIKRNIASSRKALDLTLKVNDIARLKSYNKFIVALGEDMEIVNEEGIIKSIVENSLIPSLRRDN